MKQVFLDLQQEITTKHFPFRHTDSVKNANSPK